MNGYKILVFGIVSALWGCGASVQYARTNPSPRPMHPRPPDSVVVYSSGRPAQAYAEVGVLISRQSSEFSMADLQDIIDEMRETAAEIGCDGLIIQGGADKVVSFDGTSSTLEGVRGTCIVFAPVASDHASR